MNGQLSFPGMTREIVAPVRVETYALDIDPVLLALGSTTPALVGIDWKVVRKVAQQTVRKGGEKGLDDYLLTLIGRSLENTNEPVSSLLLVRRGDGSASSLPAFVIPFLWTKLGSQVRSCHVVLAGGYAVLVKQEKMSLPVGITYQTAKPRAMSMGREVSLWVG